MCQKTLYGFCVFHIWIEHSNSSRALLTCLFLVGTYVCCSFFLANIQGQIPRSLMDADNLTFINFNSRANKHLSSLLWASKRIWSTCSILKSNLKINNLSLMYERDIDFLEFHAIIKAVNYQLLSMIKRRSQSWVLGSKAIIFEVWCMNSNKEITSEPWSRVLISPAQGP